MFALIAAWVTRRGWVIVAVWLALTAALYLRAPAWESVSRDDDVRFFPPGYPSVIGQELLERGFPRDAYSSSVVLIAERRPGQLKDADLAYVGRIVERINQLRQDPKLGIKQVLSYQTPVIGPRLRNRGRDGQGEAVLTQVALRATYQAKEARLTVDVIQKALEQLPTRPPEGLALALTGSAVVGHDMNEASIASVNNTTHATIALVVIILLVVYRSPLLALIPLVTIALSVWVSLLGIAMLTELPGLNFRVINITNIFVVVVLFGAGTDYCLFLIARYREELARGRDRKAALVEAIEQVGGALVASAGTVICGLGMLWFSSFAKIQYTGPSIGLSLAVGLVASLTLAPVLLYWLRGAVFWPFRTPHHEKGADAESESLAELPLARFWIGVGDLVTRRPGLILGVSLLALAPLAVVGARTSPSYSQLADLSPEHESVRGAQMVQRYFPVGELGPTSVLIAHPKIDFLSPRGREDIAKLSRRLAALPEVAEVRSLSQPLGKPQAEPKAGEGPAPPAATEAEPAAAGSSGPSPSPSPAASASNLFRQFQAEGLSAVFRQADQMVRTIEDMHYVSTQAEGRDRNRITRLDLVFKSDPFAPESLGALRRVQLEVNRFVDAGPLAGASAVGLTGASALVSDLKQVTTNDEHQMYALVTLGVYAILVLLLRRPGTCLYLIATVVLGYLASLGLTELVFRSLHHGPDPWPGLDWKVGFFLFVILVAVGEDYNIFLMARVIEEENKHGPIEGTRRAVAHTGGIISSCGLIMAGTFGSMLVASLTALRELGFALCLGVLLDTFIVRPILVPAFVVLINRGGRVPSGAPAPHGSARDKEQAATTSAP